MDNARTTSNLLRTENQKLKAETKELKKELGKMKDLFNSEQLELLKVLVSTQEVHFSDIVLDGGYTPGNCIL